MTRRQSIGGPLNLAALSALATVHRPHDQAQLAAVARDLAATGLHVRDIATAMRLTEPAVHQLLNLEVHHDL